MTDPVVGMTQEGEPIRAKDFGYVSYDNAPDPVNQPAHYKVKGFECIDIVEALGLGYHMGNVVKYVFRAKNKDNYLQDLKKARWYLDRYITLLENAE
jgi:hypothetical protein